MSEDSIDSEIEVGDKKLMIDIDLQLYTLCNANCISEVADIRKLSLPIPQQNGCPKVARNLNFPFSKNLYR
ncbi:unnamed protein product [Rhodiola kirilowii]